MCLLSKHFTTWNAHNMRFSSTEKPLFFVTSSILVPRAYDPSGLRQESRALGATIFEITKEITEFCPSGFT